MESHEFIGDAPAAKQPDEGATVFKSRLQAKRLERMQQRQVASVDRQEMAVKAATLRFEDPARHGVASPKKLPIRSAALARPHSSHSHQPETAESMETELKRRMRADARRALMNYSGTAWDAVKANDLEILQCFVLVEGTSRLLSRGSPNLIDGGRSLLHCAAWLGNESIVRFLLTAGAAVDAIDTVASKTTPLLDAARVGHVTVCVLLLRNNANAAHRDTHGDTAFHWAARRGHGSLLLAMALEVEKLECGSTAGIWTKKNLKGKTVLDYVQAHPSILPLLEKRLGQKFTQETSTQKRRSRFPFKAVAMGTTTRGFQFNTSARSMTTTAIDEEDTRDLDSTRTFGSSPSSQALTPLIGVDSLGLDVASFAYKSRDELASR